MSHKICYFSFLLVSSLLSCSNQSTQKDDKIETIVQDSNIQVQDIDHTPQNVKRNNTVNAGFADALEKPITITVPCFGVRDAQTLDMLPNPTDAPRKDSTLIAQLNSGNICLLQPGTKGILTAEAGNKVLVRLNVGEVWIWKSACQ